MNSPQVIENKPFAVPLSTNIDERGRLVALEHLPFEMQRVFILGDLNQDTNRACHAVSCDEFIVILSGTCQLEIRGKQTTINYDLNDPSIGYYIPAGLWIRLYDFSQDANILVACSKTYDATEYFSEPQI